MAKKYRYPQALADMVLAISVHFGDYLTPREGYIISQVIAGRSFDDLGDELHLVRLRVMNIYTKCLGKIQALNNVLQTKNDEIARLNSEINALKHESIPEETKQLLRLLLTPIHDIDVSNRIKNGLNGKVNTVLDVVHMSRKEAMNIKALGAKSIDELDAWLNAHGLTFGMNINDYLK